MGAAYGCITQRRSRATRSSGGLDTEAPHGLPAGRVARADGCARQLVGAFVQRYAGVAWHVDERQSLVAGHLLLDACDQFLVDLWLPALGEHADGVLAVRVHDKRQLALVGFERAQN